MRRLVPLTLFAAALSCVFPVARVSGIELSWRFLEGNDVDGDEAQRFRTCEGMETTEIEVTVTDEDDPERRRVFPYDCETGFQTVEQFQSRASDVFIELDRGTYNVVLEAVDKDGQTVLVDRATVGVESRGVTVQGWPLPIPTTDWAVDLRGTEACEELTLRMRYADPSQTLADPEEASDTGDDGGTGDDLDVTYRTGLQSDGGLSVGGETVHGCADLEVGNHVFANVDVGEYMLDVDVDGELCPVAVTVRDGDPPLSLDLANLPCAG